MLVTAKPYVRDSQNTWAFVRYRHDYPGRYWSIGGESPMFAFRTNQSNPTLWMYHKGQSRWVHARDAGYRVIGHAALGNPCGGRVIPDSFIPRNGRWESKAEVVLNC